MQFDFNLGPGASQTIDVRGRFFKYKNGTGPIRVRTSMGGYVDVLPGQGIENINFTSLTISDRSNAENVGTILAGEFDFRDDRITGSVEVIDGGRSRTNAGLAFTAHLYTPAVAGCISAVQLLNPAGSNKNVVVNQIQGVIAGGYSLQMKLFAGSIDGMGTPGAGSIGSKKAGGPASVAQIVCLANNNGLSPISSPPFATANGTVMRLSEPFLLVPGWGLVLASPVVNTACGAELEFFEEPIL